LAIGFASWAVVQAFEVADFVLGHAEAHCLHGLDSFEETAEAVADSVPRHAEAHCLHGVDSFEVTAEAAAAPEYCRDDADACFAC